MRKLRHPGAVMGVFALGLESTGVASGAYVYGDSPLNILGVPLCIPVMWVLVMALAYVISKEHGSLVGVLSAYSLDLARAHTLTIYHKYFVNEHSSLRARNEIACKSDAAPFP